MTEVIRDPSNLDYVYINGQRIRDLSSFTKYDISRGSMEVQKDRKNSLLLPMRRRRPHLGHVNANAKQAKRLKKRQRLYSEVSDKQGFKRPGSMNRHKSCSIKGEVDD